MKTLIQIKSEVDGRAKLIGATEHYSLPTYGHSEDLARPHVEVDSENYHLVVVERGEELSRFTTSELDDLLYRIFRGVTFSLATEYELKHRIETQDCRRMIFSKQIELLADISESWARREEEEHARILTNYPYDDRAN